MISQIYKSLVNNRVQTVLINDYLYYPIDEFCNHIIIKHRFGRACIYLYDIERNLKMFKTAKNTGEILKSMKEIKAPTIGGINVGINDIIIY